MDRVKQKVYIATGLLVLLLCLMAPLSADAAAKGSGDGTGNSAVTWTEDTMPTASDNTVVGTDQTTFLTPVTDGYMRVVYDGTGIVIENYDASFNMLRKGWLPLELDIWGGFFAGADGSYYLAEGQSNEAQDENAELIRVIKYDSSWNRVGAASINSGESKAPFDSSNIDMTESDGTLYLATGCQGLRLIAVDEASMEGQIIDSDSSRSFAQYMEKRESDLYLLEQSVGERCTQLRRYTFPDPDHSDTVCALKYGGGSTSTQDTPCYATVDGVALSSENVLGLGASIDQSQFDSVTSDTAHNIYLTVTPISNFTEEATAVKWLTGNEGNGKAFLGEYITKVSDDRFLVSWEECIDASSDLTDLTDTLSFGKLHYVFVDGSGNVIGDEFVADAVISDCKPVLSDGKIVYCASSANMVNFYFIDAQSGAFSKKSYRVAGRNATWDFDNGILSFSGTGPIDISLDSVSRTPVSSTRHYSTTNTINGAWKKLRTSVTQISFGEGITSIGERAFANFDNITSVEIAEGMTSIGKEAFFSCDALETITIPASVKEIGDDFLWTGQKWTSDQTHVTTAQITSLCTAYAIEYAKTNNIKYELIHSFGDYEVKEATCEEDGYKVRTCSACHEEERETYRATGHLFGDYVVVKAATCTEDGYEERTCEYCGQKKGQVLTAIGHKWSEPKYEWAEDHSTVTATRECSNDSSHNETETVETTSKVIQEQTSTRKGIIEYTAEFKNPAFETQTEEVITGEDVEEDESVRITVRPQTVKARKLKKKAVVVQPFKVDNPHAAVSYKVKKYFGKSKKVLKLDRTTGEVTVKKGTGKGTYKMKVKIRFAGTDEYEASSAKAVVAVIVK